MRHEIRLAALAVLCPVGMASAATLIHAGKLIDGVSATARDRVTIVVDGDRIRSVDSGFATAGNWRRSHRSFGSDRTARIHGHARAPDLRAQPHQRAGQHQEGRIRPRLRLRRVRGAHAARRLHDSAEPRRRLQHVDRAQARGGRGKGQGTANIHLRPFDRYAGRACGCDEFVRSVPDQHRPAPRHRLQWPGQLPRGGAPALQGRRGLDQDHGDRRRAVDREIGQRAAVHRRGARGRHDDGTRLRHEGGRPRARRRGHEAGDPQRHRLDRARHLHGRRSASAS